MKKTCIKKVGVHVHFGYPEITFSIHYCVLERKKKCTAKPINRAEFHVNMNICFIIFNYIFFQILFGLLLFKFSVGIGTFIFLKCFISIVVKKKHVHVEYPILINIMIQDDMRVCVIFVVHINIDL